jgi:hypothetical protein
LSLVTGGGGALLHSLELLIPERGELRAIVSFILHQLRRSSLSVIDGHDTDSRRRECKTLQFLQPASRRSTISSSISYFAPKTRLNNKEDAP